MRLGLAGAAGPYRGLTAHLEQDPAIIQAARIGWRLGCSPMEVLRSDDLEWQFWLAMARSLDLDLSEQRGV